MTSWYDDYPLPGQFVKTRNGRNAYEVIEVIPNGRPNNAATFIVDRRGAGAIKPGDVVHEFRWNKR